MVRPDADPDSVENVGAVGNVIRNPIDEERKEVLEKLMSSSILPESHENQDGGQQVYEKILPANSEEIIPREKLRPAPDEWNFFGRPRPDQYALIFQSVYKYGLWHPITVWEQEDGTYMILGGHTRDLVYDELYQMTNDPAYLQIQCKIYKRDSISEVTARRIVILTNIAQRAQENPKLRIRCYCEMARLEKMEAFYGSGIDTNAAVAKLFGVSRATVFFYRKLENLIDEFVEALEHNVISRQAATILSGLPSELQYYILQKGYHTDLNPIRLRNLKKARSEEDVEKAFHSAHEGIKRYQYVFSSAVKKPKNFDTLPLYVGHDDMNEFKSLLQNALSNADNISEDTKRIVFEMLNT